MKSADISITLKGWMCGALLALAGAAHAASFERTFGGLDYDDGMAIDVTSDGGFIITGRSGPLQLGNTAIPLIRTDSSGNQLWAQTYDVGTGIDFGGAVQQAADGGFAVAGGISDFAGPAAAWLLKTDSNGNEEWSRSYTAAGEDESFSALQQTADGGYVLVGRTGPVGGGTGTFDLLVVKTDSLGNPQWRRTFGGSSEDTGKDVRELSGGGFIVIGRTLSFGAGGYDVWLLRLDSAGNPVWQRTYGSAQPDLGSSVRQTADGGLVLAGLTYSFGAVLSDLYLIKTDANGNELWHRTFGTASTDEGAAVRQSADGGYLVAGITRGHGPGKNGNAWLLKTDANGKFAWSRTFGGNGEDSASDLELTADGGAVMVGQTAPQGSSLTDIYLVFQDATVPAAPVIDVKANGSDGPLSVSSGQTVTFQLTLSPGDYEGFATDLYVGFLTPSGNFWSTPSGWKPSVTPVVYEFVPVKTLGPYTGFAWHLPVGGLPAGRDSRRPPKRDLRRAHLGRSGVGHCRALKAAFDGVPWPCPRVSRFRSAPGIRERVAPPSSPRLRLTPPGSWRQRGCRQRRRHRARWSRGAGVRGAPSRCAGTPRRPAGPGRSARTPWGRAAHWQEASRFAAWCR